MRRRWRSLIGGRSSRTSKSSSAASAPRWPTCRLAIASSSRRQANVNSNDMDDATYTPPESLDRLRRRALVVGVVGLVAAGVGAVFNLNQFLHSYLLAFFLS